MTPTHPMSQHRLSKPPRLQPGDTIAVVTPAGPPLSAERLQAGIRRLQAYGYQVEVQDPPFTSRGYLAASDEERSAQLNRYFLRPEVKALFCARGGYGSLRLLPFLDYEAARNHPTLLIGYSDITALHLALYHKAGLPGLSGPMVAVEWGDLDGASEELFWSLAQGATPPNVLGPSGETLAPMRPGRAEGPLLGGNLSVLSRLIGTPYMPSLEGALLFLEEVDEAPYRIDRMLAHLKLAGALDRLGGLILGRFIPPVEAPRSPTLSFDDVFADYFTAAPFPVAQGLVYGHFPIKNTLPIGVQARLQVTHREATLAILEPVVEHSSSYAF